MVQQKSRQESLADEAKRESNKKNKILKKVIRKKLDDMSYIKREKNEDLENYKESLLKDKKDEETKKEIKRDPRQEPYIPRDYINNPPTLKELQKYFAENTNAKGGMINKYAKGGAVKKNKMITTKGWGASRKT